MKKLAAILMFVPLIAHAEFWTGNDLYNKLTSSDSMERIHAMGYVVGIYDANVKVHFCPNEAGITVGQITDITKNYLAANPSTRNLAAYGLVTVAFRQIWPCTNKQQNGRGA